MYFQWYKAQRCTQTFAGARAAGQWYGLQGIAGQIAGVIAPIVTALIVDSTGQFAWAFVIAAAVLLFGAGASIFDSSIRVLFSGQPHPQQPPSLLRGR
jgi:sugar phosphate permease